LCAYAVFTIVTETFIYSRIVVTNINKYTRICGNINPRESSRVFFSNKKNLVVNETMLLRFENRVDGDNGLSGVLYRRSKRHKMACDEDIIYSDKYFKHRDAAR
jgi:hypothetical protein